MEYFKGKHILLIMPVFFGYEIEVAVALRKTGALVDWMPDRPFKSTLLKVVARTSPRLITWWADILYKNALNDFSVSKYDYIFVINGQTLSSRTLRLLKNKYPAASYILYMWDSVANRKNIKNNFQFYDKIFTFDPYDAKKFGLFFRPLFYCDGFNKLSSRRDFAYHLSFVGTAHSDRYQIINRLRCKLPSYVKSYLYLYLQSKAVYWLSKLLRPGMLTARKSEFNFSPLGKKDVESIFSNSFAILDIEHPNQTGLTIRSFETMGSCKKLVTTNTAIRDYDFFSQNNICIIDRNNPTIPENFFHTPYLQLPELIRNRYSINGWLREIFED